jgi:hypothetical protein
MGRSCWRCKIGGDPPGGRRGGAVAGERCRGEEKEDGLLKYMEFTRRMDYQRQIKYLTP